jgi:hypothetical protein
MSEQDNEDLYPCIGVCMADPASGLCQGCGRPLAEPVAPEPPALVSTTSAVNGGASSTGDGAKGDH